MAMAKVVPGNEAPDQQQMRFSGRGEQLNEIIGDANWLLVEQKVGLLEAFTGGACEQNNNYRVRNDRGEEVMYIKEDAAGCARCCCNPYHATKLYVSDSQTNETLLTLEREGLAFPCPQKCLGNYIICCDCCADGIKVYEGHVFGSPGELVNPPQPMVTVKQPYLGGYFTPTLDVYPKGNTEAPPSATITGPCCLGGASELCCKSTFNYASTGGNLKGSIVHLTPESCLDVCAEICTDVDHFRITYNQDATTEDKATMLASSILVDYMFFEMDNGMLACKDGKLEITCCFTFCWNLSCASFCWTSLWDDLW